MISIVVSALDPGLRDLDYTLAGVVVLWSCNWTKASNGYHSELKITSKTLGITVSCDGFTKI